jgi:diguanylate cyclase (GGDEF)-like protein
MIKQIFTVKELERLIDNYRITFDIVNIVDVESKKKKIVYKGFLADGKELCFTSTINKENTNNYIGNDISLLSKKSRIEEVDDKLYLIITLPIDLIDDKRVINNYVLELVMNLTKDYKRKGSDFNDFKELYVESFIDELTGVYNYEYFDSKEYVKMINPEGKYEFTYVFADIHRFKKINMNYGELVGDRILVQVAETLVNNLRDTDKVIRLKNDGFIIILKNTDEEFIKSKIELLRNKMKTIIYDKKNGYFPIVAFGYNVLSSIDFNDEIERNALKVAKEMLVNEKMFS